MEDLDKLSEEYASACEAYVQEYATYSVSRKSLDAYAAARRKAREALDMEINRRYYVDAHKVTYELD